MVSLAGTVATSVFAQPWQAADRREEEERSTDAAQTSAGERQDAGWDARYPVEIRRHVYRDLGRAERYHEDILRRARWERERRPMWQRDRDGWREGRARRAHDHRLAIARIWGDYLATERMRGELAMHGHRMARLDRIVDLAQRAGSRDLAVQARRVGAKEIARHVRAMDTIRIETEAVL